MRDNIWTKEINRLGLVGLAAVLIGLTTGYWLYGLIFVLIGYLVWIHFKIFQLLRWMKHGAIPKYYPDSDGIWEEIAYQVQNMRSKSNRRKKRMSKLIKRFQQIVKGLPYATVVLTGENEIDWANKNSEFLLNINLQKDRGQRIDNIVRLSKLSAILTKHAPKKTQINMPHQHNRQLQVQVIPVQKDLKLLIAQDVSDYVNAQQIRRNFIANASHELRTPLTVISGYLEMMQLDEKLPNHLRPIIDTANEQSNRMRMIIEDMLTLSKLERSQLESDKCTQVNVPAILRLICNEEVKRLHSKTHNVDIQVDEDLWLNGSESEITSVCTNLIYNAVKHTPKGTSIEVTWGREKNGLAVLSVKDNGEGIAFQHVTRLTERFYRVDQSRSREAGGTGLGLAIVQHIMQRHGGKLDIVSRIGEGSCFSAQFPHSRVITKSAVN